MSKYDKLKVIINMKSIVASEPMIAIKNKVVFWPTSKNNRFIDSRPL